MWLSNMIYFVNYFRKLTSQLVIQSASYLASVSKLVTFISKFIIIYSWNLLYYIS